MGSNHRPSGYEPDELPLLYSAIHTIFSNGTAKVLLFFDIRKFLGKKVLKNIIFCQIMHLRGLFNLYTGHRIDLIATDNANLSVLQNFTGDG